MIRVEIDVESPMASRSLRKAIMPVLERFDLEQHMSFDYVGQAPPDSETRSLPPEPMEAASYVVHELRIHLPGTLIEKGTTVVVAAIVQAIKRWRRKTGNTGLEVPIFGPDGEVLAVVERDTETHTEFQIPPDR
jgi:hypothetical protein